MSNKKELVRAVSKDTKLSIKESEEVVTSVFDNMMKLIKKNGSLQIKNFVTIKTSYQEPRKGHNPKTGEPVDISGRMAARAKFGKSFKDYINKSVKAKKPATKKATKKTAKKATKAKKTSKKK
jgi:nucleoid DNA-binding protein